MASGRTIASKWNRVYMDGLDMSGYARSIGPLSWEYAETDLRAMSDAAAGGLPGIATIGLGTLSAVFDNTATVGLHAIASGAGAKRLVTVARGVRAAPVAGDPCFTSYAVQKNYMAEDDAGASFVRIDFGPTDVTEFANYTKPWGTVIHALGSETAVNAAAGVDDRGAATALGGYMVYHITSITGAGTVTLTVEEASTNTDVNFGALTDATSGAIATASAPIGDIVPVATDAAVKRYLRPQIAFGGSATACTFMMAFVRI